LTVQDARGIATDLVLCGISVQILPFRQQVELAARHGFDAITAIGGLLRRCVDKEGMTLPEIRTIADDAGIRITDVEASGGWLSPAIPGTPRWLTPAYDVAGFLEAAVTLGAKNLVAVHFGAPPDPDVAVERFVALCGQAAQHGIQVAFEFPAFATIRDVAACWDIVRAADQPNGGLLIDSWHHYRGGGDDEVLRSIPGDRIFSVQLSDGLAEPQGSLIEDAAGRLLPGEGAFDIPRFLDLLAGNGVRCPVGVEIFDRAGLESDPDRTVAGMATAMREVLGIAPAAS